MENRNTSYYQYNKKKPYYSKRSIAFTPSLPPNRTPLYPMDEGSSKKPKPKKSNMLESSKNLLKDVYKYAQTPEGKVVLGHVFNYANAAFHSGKKHIPYAMSTDRRKGTTEGATSYVINLHLGYRSTRSVYQAGKTNGTTILELSNSLSKIKTKAQGRMKLSQAVGFNEKRFDFLGSQFTHTFSNYNKIYKISDTTYDKNSRTVPYALVLEQYNNIKIRNSNTYHPAKFKVHFIKIFDDDVNMFTLYNKTFNAKIDLQQVGAIPIVYQKTSTEKSSSNFLHPVTCYKGTTVNLSSSFKNHVTIVHTVSKVLGPGDLLDLRITYFCGAGMRFDVAQDYLNTPAKGSQPTTYGYIVEVEGTDCEGVLHQDNLRFQGSSPVWYNYEYRTCIKLVKHMNLVSSSNLENLEAMGKSYAVRVFDREFLEDRPFSIAASQIGDPGEAGKTFSVISTAIERVVYSKDSSVIPNSSIENDITEEPYTELEEEEFDDD